MMHAVMHVYHVSVAGLSRDDTVPASACFYVTLKATSWTVCNMCTSLHVVQIHTFKMMQMLCATMYR